MERICKFFHPSESNGLRLILFVEIIQIIPHRFPVIKIFLAEIDKTSTLGVTYLMTPIPILLMKGVILTYHFLKLRFRHIHTPCLM